MKSITKLGLVVGGVLLVVLVIFFLGGFSSTGNVVLSESGAMTQFVSCLNEKGVLMYGFTNNPSVDAQFRLFGVHVLNLTVIDCHASPEKCVGVIIYPSWRVSDRIISSGLSIGMLSDLSGCKL